VETERRWLRRTAKHHDYHLVDPSPWPIVGAVSAFIMAVGAICGCTIWQRMRRSFSASAPSACLHHDRLVADVIHEASRGRSHPRGADQPPLRHDPVHRLRGDVLRRLVLGLLQHRAVPGDQIQARSRFTGGVWPPKGIETFDPWHLPLLNTLILLTSGTTVTWAHHALLENDRKGLKSG
jgi:cytochrome c oxidase subunit 3